MSSEYGAGDMKHYRKENPSGWMELTRYETVRFLIDTFLDSINSREFSKAELARKSGMSANILGDHLDYLIKRGIVKELDDRGTTRYTVNEDSPIYRDIKSLDETVNRVRVGELPKTIQTNQVPDDASNRSFNLATIGTGRSLSQIGDKGNIARAVPSSY